MEDGIWFLVWILQTFIGAVLWRRFGDEDVDKLPTGEILFLSALVLANIIGVFILFSRLIILIFNKLLFLIDYLAGKKK